MPTELLIIWLFLAVVSVLAVGCYLWVTRAERLTHFDRYNKQLERH